MRVGILRSRVTLRVRVGASKEIAQLFFATSPLSSSNRLRTNTAAVLPINDFGQQQINVKLGSQQEVGVASFQPNRLISRHVK